MNEQLRRVVRPWMVTLAIAGLYAIVLLRAAGGDPLVLLRVGTRFSAGDPAGSTGYDGQFYYYIARDPGEGWRYVDVPAYRYQRILYPLVARALSLGHERALPWTLLAINLGSLAASVAIVEALLVDCGVSRWYALTVGLYGGQLFPALVGLADPLALCLALAAMLVYARRGWLWGGGLFALAVLCKETMWVVALAYVVYLLKRGRFRPGLALGAIVTLPFVLWQVCLWFWLGEPGIRAGGAGATPFHVIPFGALLSLVRVGWDVLALFAAIWLPLIVVPTLWAILAGGRSLLGGENHPWTWALLFVAIVIPFLPASTLLDLSAMPRFASPLVALTILFAAYHRRARVLNASLLWMTTAVLVPLT
jgi:hypothetical protein